jgi:uncharacterized damage-inducible protein DinB
MPIENYKALFQYNAWANQRTLEACATLTTEQFTRDLESSFRSVRDTIVHIMGVESIWLERWKQNPNLAFAKAADYPDIASVKTAWQKIEADLISYVNGLTQEDLNRIVPHKNFSGQEFRMPLWQMMQHLLNHQTYHRGQITTLVRQVGGKPLGTDLIGFYRGHPEFADIGA